jgi:hypothetical protein
VLRTGEERQIVIEVLAQRDAHHVRGIALTPTQGLARGMTVESDRSAKRSESRRPAPPQHRPSRGKSRSGQCHDRAACAARSETSTGGRACRRRS